MADKLSNNPFECNDSPERRVLSLEDDNIPCVPFLNLSHYKKRRPSINKHVHPGCLEITYCLRGSLLFVCNDKEYHLLPGNIFITQPHETHHLITNPKGLVMYGMFFRYSLKNESILHLPAGESKVLQKELQSIPRRVIKGNERIRAAFQQLFLIYDTHPRGEFRSLSMRSTILDLLLSLIKASKTSNEKISNDKVAKLVKMMSLHPEEDYTQDFLMRESSLSESRLNTRFKQITGLPPYTYLLNCRLNTARQRLLSTKESITQIAFDLGFCTSQHFAVQFKRAYGMTPSQCRRNTPS